MDYVGFLCLGVFASAFATTAWPTDKEQRQAAQFGFALLPMLLSGAVLALVAKFRYSPGLGCFPLGLLIGFMWTKLGAILAWANSLVLPKTALAWGCVGIVVATTIAGIGVAGIMLMVHTSAELSTPLDDRLGDLHESRSRANARAEPASTASAPTSASAASAASTPGGTAAATLASSNAVSSVGGSASAKTRATTGMQPASHP